MLPYPPEQETRPPDSLHVTDALRVTCTTPIADPTRTRQVTVPSNVSVEAPTNSTVWPSPHCSFPSCPGILKRTEYVPVAAGSGGGVASGAGFGAEAGAFG